MRLTRNQTTSRTTIENLASTALLPTVLTARICTALTLAIPNDGLRLFGIDPATLLVNRLLAASDGDHWARSEWLSDVYLAADEIPYMELPTLMRLRLPVVASHARQAQCWGYPAAVLAELSPDEHERAFHAVGSPEGGTILASFASRGSWVAALQLYRRDPRSPFSRSDVAFLRSLATLIGDALAGALAHERALATDDVDNPSGILILSKEASITFATPAGEIWLDRLRAIEAGLADNLPTPISAAVASLRAAGSKRPPLTARLPNSRLLIEATAGGADGSVAIVMSPQRPSLPPTIPESWPLTPQEREITGLLIQGKSNRAIADGLFISENTVQTHLRHIYSKLEVTGRTRLLARLFHEQAGTHGLDEGVA